MVNGAKRLPDDWVWEPVNKIGEVVTGTTPSKANQNYYGEEFPFYKPTDLDAGFFTKDSRDGLSSLGIQKARLLPAKSVLVTWIGATIGKTGLIRVAGASNQQINAIIPNKNIVPEYLYYACVSPLFQKSIQDSASATTLPILNKRKFEQLLVPIAPFPEQERIVARIEELFTQLEAGASALERVQAGLRRYKASVLKTAVEGKLAANGKVESGELLKGWRQVTLSEITSQIKDADHKMPKPAESDIPYVSTKDFIGDDDIDFENAKHISKEDHQALTRKIKPELNDILLSRYGTVGQIRKVKTTRAFQASYSIAIVKPLESKVLTDYLVILLRSEIGQQQMRNNIRASSQPDLGLESIRKFTFPLPPLEEQRQIVAEVERRLSVAREVESEVEAALVRASRLRQAVLKSAFEGRL